jgi:hypothetical protein
MSEIQRWRPLLKQVELADTLGQTSVHIDCTLEEQSAAISTCSNATAGKIHRPPDELH